MKITSTIAMDIDEDLDRFESALKEIYQEGFFPADGPILPADAQPIFDEAYKRCKRYPLSKEVMALINDPAGEVEMLLKGNAEMAVFKHVRYLPSIWHTHKVFEIGCVMQGEIMHYTAGKEMKLVPGDIFIIAPDSRHAIGAFEDNCLILNILFRRSGYDNSFFELLSADDILSEFFRRIIFDQGRIPYLLFHTGDNKEILNCLVRIYEESKRIKDNGQILMHILLSELFLQLLRVDIADVEIPSIENAPASENVDLILKYINTRYATLTLTELSSFFNYSPRHLERILISSAGKSFKDLIMDAKMKHAAEALRAGTPVGKIAESLGYNDTSAFRQAFKRYYGVSPREYRK